MDSSPTNVEEESIIHDDAFYLDNDPMAIFLVENRLFKVHQFYLIQGSEIFRNMFTEAGGGDCSATEGRSDEQPIVLPDVTVKEFKTLLRFFYAMAKHLDNRSTGFDLLNLSFDEKLAILSISHRYMFDDIFKFMLHVVSPDQLSVLDRIRLGDKYGLSDWLLSGYEKLVESISTRLTKEEIDFLGTDRVVQLLEAKIFLNDERWKNNIYCTSCGAGSSGRRNISRCDKCTFGYLGIRTSPTPTSKEVAVKFFAL